MKMAAGLRRRYDPAMPLAIPCPQCGKLPPPACDCPPLPPGPADPPPAPAAAPAPPAKKLRSETIKMRREKRGGGRELIILEGDHRDALEGLLLEAGFRSKRAGG